MSSFPIPQQEPVDETQQMLEANGATPVSPTIAKPGATKQGLRAVLAGMLGNFRYGAGQAMMKYAGLPTDQDIAIQNAQIAHANAQTQLVQQQAEQMKNMVPIDVGDGNIYHVPQAMATKLLEARIKAQGQVQAAGTSKRFITVPNVGLFDTESQQVVPGTAGGIQITPEIAQQYKIPAEYIGKPMRLTDLAAFERGQVFQNVPVMTASGPVVVNRQTAQATPVTGPGGARYSPPALATPREVADPNNPGQTVIVPAGQAIGMAGAQSASVQVPKVAARAEVPTNIGNQKVAFTTAIQHAELLREASKALANGDQQQLNQLQNQFANAFGAAGPVTAQAIADAYNREVTAMLSKGHMTDSEISTVGKTVNPSAQNFAQIDSVLGAYQNLAQSKMNMLDQQTRNAVENSQPKVPKAVKNRMPKSSGGFDWNTAPVVK